MNLKKKKKIEETEIKRNVISRKFHFYVSRNSICDIIGTCSSDLCNCGREENNQRGIKKFVETKRSPGIQ